MAAHKTKAALQSRSCRFTASNSSFQDITVIDQVNGEAGNPASETGIPVSVMHTALSGEAEQHNRIGSVQDGLSLSESVAAGGQTPDMADAHPFGSLRPNIFLQIEINWSFSGLLHVAGGAEMNLKARNATATIVIRIIHLRIVYPFDVQCLEKNRNIQKATVITTIKTDCHGLIISRSPLECVYQPFGSIPRFFNSALPSSFNQLARLVPSPFASNSNCSFNSGGMRTWNAGAFPVPFGCLSLLMIVDMCVPIGVMFLLIGTYLITVVSKKTTPRTVGAVPRRLTKPLVGVTIMAESQSTQTRPKFTWRFLAVDKSTPGMRPITLYTNAPTEEEARDNLPGLILYFAARLPLHIPEPVGVNHA